MPAERREEIAALLASRLDELRRRDGDLGGPARAVARAARTTAVAVPAPALDELAMQRRLIDRHRGHTLASALPGAVVEGAGDILEVRSTIAAGVAVPARDRAAADLEASLWLMPGVRDGVARRLAAAGYAGLAALETHPRFGPAARRLRRMVARGDAAAIMSHLATRAARGHPMALALAAFFDARDMLFLDIETMGLFGGSPIVVAGVAHAAAGGAEVRQLVAATPAGESALVAALAAEIESHAALVTFNGRSFDLPYVCQRAAYYGRPVTADPVHFDLLPFSRRAFAGRVPDCRLDTLARHVLGMDRGEDVPGSLVPSFYRDYLEDPEERIGLLVAIVEHNLADMEQTVRLFATLVSVAGIVP